MKPFSSYNGGKAGNGTYQNIINHIPKCNVFIDAMVGNGGILFNLKLPGLTVINDIDSGVIEKYDIQHFENIIIENFDYRSIIAKYDCDRSYNIFFYFDPPYLKSSRKSQKDLYRYEWNESQHIEFLSLTNTVKSNCMISHYPCELYDNYLKGWKTFDFQSTTRNGTATERIYMNYEKPTILQDFRYLGKDYIDRQRIKRKVQRFIKKLETLPDDERTAILTAVIDKNNYTAAQIFSSIRS